MAYDQLEANRRFEGLLGLFKRVHDKARQPINTRTELVAIATEARMLMDAYEEEIDMYLKYCGNENMHKPTITLVLNIQSLSSCTSIHIHIAEARLNAILKNSEGIAKAAAEADQYRWN